MVARTRFAQTGGSRLPRPGNALKVKVPKKAKAWSYTKKGLGHIYKTPAYLVRGTSAALGGVVGLGTKRLTTQAVRGIQLRLAKRAQKTEQSKINTILGLRKKTGWFGRSKKNANLEQAIKHDELEALDQKIQSLRETGKKGKELESALKRRETLNKSLGAISLGAISYSKNPGETYVQALRRTQSGAITNASQKALLNLRTRKLTAKTNAISAANIKYKKAKAASKNILSNTAKITKKAVVDVANMSAKKITAMYSLAVLGAPGATPMALLAMPVYDIVKTMAKDVPAIAKLSNRFKNLFRSKSDLMNQLNKNDSNKQKLKKGIDSQRFKLDGDMEILKNKKILTEDDVQKMKTNLDTIRAKTGEIDSLKMQISKAKNNTSRREFEQKLLTANAELGQSKAEHNTFISGLYEKARTQLSPESKSQLTSALDSSVKITRLVDLSSQLDSKQRDTKRKLMQKQKADIQLLNDSLNSSSPVALALNSATKRLGNFYKQNQKKTPDIDTLDMDKLTKTYQQIKSDSYSNASLEIPARYLESLITAKIMHESFNELSQTLPSNPSATA